MSDRKYRQRGYRDDNRPSTERKQPGPPREKKEGPRGRGLGSPSVTVFRCRDCGQRHLDTQSVEGTTVCAKCGAPLHACVNCAAFDPGARWECREPIERPVASKTKANQCTFFRPKLTTEFESSERATPDDARSAFDALFKL